MGRVYTRNKKVLGHSRVQQQLDLQPFSMGTWSGDLRLLRTHTDKQRRLMQLFSIRAARVSSIRLLPVRSVPIYKELIPRSMAWGQSSQA